MNKIAPVLLLAATFVGPASAQPCSPDEIAKLLASDGAGGDQFGWSASVWGDVAVIGAPFDDDNGSGSGSAYIYRFDGTSWAAEAKLLAADAAEGDRFGDSVSVSGDTAVIGANADDDNGFDSGSAYVFRFDGTNWVQEAKLLAADGAEVDFFGDSVSFSGDTAVIGAYRDDDNGNQSGSAYVYRFDGTSWVQEAKLLAADGAVGDELGFSISVSGDTAVIGAYRDDDNGTNSGSAYIFDLNCITAPGPSLIGDDYIADLYAFGSLFASNNDTALVGPDADGTWSGAESIPYDLEADTINVESAVTIGSWASGVVFEFRDLDFDVPDMRIVGVNIVRATGAGWDQIDLSDISFTDNSVRIDAAEIAGITPALDQGITVQVISGPPAPPCPGDIADDFGTLGADGMVSFGDFLALLGLVGPCPGGTPGCTGDIADDFGTLGADGMVGFGDFLALLGLVGPCP